MIRFEIHSLIFVVVVLLIKIGAQQNDETRKAN
jgi:hypothetical protein